VRHCLKKKKKKKLHKRVHRIWLHLYKVQRGYEVKTVVINGADNNYKRFRKNSRVLATQVYSLRKIIITVYPLICALYCLYNYFTFFNLKKKNKIWFFFFFGVTRVHISHLLGRRSTTWDTPPDLVLSIFKTESQNYLPRPQTSIFLISASWVENLISDIWIWIPVFPHISCITSGKLLYCTYLKCPHQ
jgi:hypothetical protein